MKLDRCLKELQAHGIKGTIEILSGKYTYVPPVEPKQESKPEPEVIIEPTEPEPVDSPIEPMPEPKKLKPKDSFRTIPKRTRKGDLPILLAVKISFEQKKKLQQIAKEHLKWLTVPDVVRGLIDSWKEFYE